MKKNNIINKKTAMGMTTAALVIGMSISAFAAAGSSTGADLQMPRFGTEAGFSQGQRREAQAPMGGMQFGQQNNGMQFGQQNDGMNFGRHFERGDAMQRPEGAGMGPMEGIKEKLDALEDSAAKKKLDALMEKLESARKALEDALKDAGIEADFGREKAFHGERMSGAPALPAEANSESAA